LSEHYGDALAVEMEGRGFLQGVHFNHPVQGCVIRGISDRLSGKANADKAGSQRRAADAASAVAFEMLGGLGDGASAIVSSTPKPPPNFIEMPSTFSAGAYYRRGEVLAQIGEPMVDQVSFSFEGSPDGYLRIIPTRPRDRPITLASLNAAAPNAELLRPSGLGGLTFLNSFGAVFYDPGGSHYGGPARLRWATQLFQNGELWSVTDTIVVKERNGRPTWVPVPLIPATVFEMAFYRALHKSVAFAIEHLDLTFPCNVELGLIGIRDKSAAIPSLALTASGGLQAAWYRSPREHLDLTFRRPGKVFVGLFFGGGLWEGVDTLDNVERMLTSHPATPLHWHN